MNIDSHQHFWMYDPARHGWIDDTMVVLRRDFLPEELAGELHANKIGASVAVQADQSEQETLFLLDLAKRSRSIAGVVGWIDLASPAIDERLQFFSRFEKLRGFRHVVQSEPDDRFVMRPDFTRGISAAIELVGKFPGQRFVVDHLAKPEIKSKDLAAWARHLRDIARSTNVYCKLSGLVTETNWQRWTLADFDPYLDVAFEAFGPDRLMFGSDWPVCLLAASYQQVKQIVEEYVDRKAPAEREKIFGANAVRFYDIKVHANGFAA
jgi:L-fuconolactonase